LIGCSGEQRCSEPNGNVVADDEYKAFIQALQAGGSDLFISMCRALIDVLTACVLISSVPDVVVDFWSFGCFYLDTLGESHHLLPKIEWLLLLW